MTIYLLALADFLACTLAAKLGRQYVMAALILNLLAVGIFAQKIITIFGYDTNISNACYAATVFCMAIICEKYKEHSKSEAFLVGLFSLLLFTMISQIIVHGDSGSLATVFHATPRNSLAGFVGYTVAMGFFVQFWDILFMPVWMKYILLLIMIQSLDSILFFVIAFYGILSPNKLIEIGTIGFMVKIVIGICSVPFLYIATRSKSLPS